MYTLGTFHFLAMPRTGSRAVGAALTERGATRHGSHHNIDLFDEVVQGGDVVVSTVRDHIDWFPSMWRHHAKSPPFPEFLRWALEPATGWVKDGRLFHEFVPLSTTVLCYETLHDDLNIALAAAGQSPVTLSPAPEKGHPTPWTRADLALVRDTFGDEMRQYGYE